ncbi:MAG TPA: hypothetical protein VMH61_05620 [Candidatus Acidoferrales bacterium]|nr:hypothetical protein [Candidatus Acidoferrales bacterium]
MLRSTASGPPAFAAGFGLLPAAFAALGALAAPHPAQAGHLATRYHIVDLGGPPAGSAGYAVNSDGVVAGYQLLGFEMPHAVLFEDGHIIDLGTLGGDASLASGVARGDRAVGWARLPDQNRHAFLWQDGVMNDLGTLGGSWSTANAISDSGLVVGGSLVPGDTVEVPFVWTASAGMQAIPVPGVSGGEAIGVNDAGDVVGSFLDNSGTLEAFRLRNGVVQVLPSLGPYATKAYGVSNTGDIVGYSYNNESHPSFHAVLWRDGVLHDLGALVSDHSGAMAVNDSGVAVGLSYDAGFTMVAVAFADSQVVDLNGFLPQGTAWHLDTAYGIATSGEITGSGTLNGATRAFTLVPDPPLPPAPERLALRAWPLPMREAGTLELDLPKSADVKLALYDLAGRRLAELARGTFGPGRVTLPVPAAALAARSGVYWVRLETRLGSSTVRMVIAR